jgi:hypothetical protein
MENLNTEKVKLGAECQEILKVNYTGAKNAS